MLLTVALQVQGTLFGYLSGIVTEDMDSSAPVLHPKAVKEGSQAADSVCDVGVGGNGNVIQAANKFSIRGVCHPGRDLGWYWFCLVRAA
jgi:hypothetical protein